MASDLSPAALRVFREIAQAGSFSAAAVSLGYTQSAVSRQVAGLEVAVGHRLFDRGRHGVTLTAAGARLLTSAIRALDEIDQAVRELEDEQAAVGPVRLGAFPTALIGLVPTALRSLPAHLKVNVREATTPALTRALRAGTLDLAVLAQSPPFRPVDAESPPLEMTILTERELMLGVAANHPLAGASIVDTAALEGQVWVASRSEGGDHLLGVWPGLAHRPEIRYVVRDWLAKLTIVAAGLAITTVAPVSLDGLPRDVTLLAVRGEPREVRRIVLARPPGVGDGPVARVADALIATARGPGHSQVRDRSSRGILKSAPVLR